jgi:uncharacterized membrane protein YphA (DoxX/SURF4 family)
MREKLANILNNKIAHIMARFILGGVFIYASIDKIFFPKEFTKTVMNYLILPDRIATYFAFLLPWIELFLGIFFIVGIFVRESALILSSLFLAFMIVITIKSLSGTLGNRGCFSASISNFNYNVGILLFRDALFLLCGLLLFFPEKLKQIRE